jgi:hypothetical protein
MMNCRPQPKRGRIELSASTSIDNQAAEALFLTTEEVCERYRGQISAGTLRNWRVLKIGPSYVKLGKVVLYPRHELEAWDKRNLVACQGSRQRSAD